MGGTLTVSVRADHDMWRIQLHRQRSRHERPADREDLRAVPDATSTAAPASALAIVYQIVQGHEGKINVRSAPGRGTEFMLQLKRPALSCPPPKRSTAHIRR